MCATVAVKVTIFSSSPRSLDARSITSSSRSTSSHTQNMNKELMYHTPKHAQNMNKELLYYFHEVDTPTYMEKNDSERSIGANNDSSGNTMNNNNMKPDKETVCNCNRAPETIFCQKCGKSFVGRRRMSCERHRNTIHLMDCAYCVFCKRQL